MYHPEPRLPEALNAFLARGGKRFECDDGDWSIEIKPAEKDPSKNVPHEALIIAGNGLGDVLFLKPLRSNSATLGETVYVFWHEEQRVAVFSNDVSQLTGLLPPEASPFRPVFYHDRSTEVRVGDKVSMRGWFRRINGSVDYVPGISAKERGLEHNGLSWVRILTERNTTVITVVDPKSHRLKRKIKFVKRAQYV
jgi:hypothetical protein